jgi:tetrahydromethanopterin S-methyltransferase subunit F
MSKNQNNIEGEVEAQPGEVNITVDIQKSIDDIIYQKKIIDRDNEAYKEAVTAVAEKLGIKAGVLSRRIALIIKEEEKGGEVKSKENDLEFVEQYFTIKSNPK